MIGNDLQLRITREEADKFEHALVVLANRPVDDREDPRFRKIEEAGLRSQLADLREDLAEYAARRARSREVVPLADLGDLPGVLVRARIAAGLTRQELAERLGIEEGEVERDEATGYASSDLARVGAVIEALGVEVRAEVVLPDLAVR